MKNLLSPIFAFVFLITSCTPKAEEKKSEETEKSTISISPVASPEFPTAKLGLVNPKGLVKDTTVKFEYTVADYTLTTQTDDAEMKHCANSSKGQHIHVILNNEPYLAKYDTKFDHVLKPGPYILLSFLSRSYHESIKTKDAYVLDQFYVGEKPKDYKPADLSTAHMFYSRPKGEYTGDDTKKVLLDFFLANTDLSPDGNKVRATIMGQEFILDKWQPYFMEGLPMGEVTIKLELIDAEGNLIEGPFNSVTRTVKLSA
ncbi:MAG: hypothetical protein ACJAZ3_000419 [Sphingobacteriales bacterium]|jgi:hypothetical protein